MSLQKLLRNKIWAFFIAAVGILGAAGLFALGTTSVDAACTQLPTTGGAASFTITAPEAGSYRLWTRLYSPSAGSDSIYARIDDTHCQIVVGDSALAKAGEFTWTDYQKGQPTDKITVDLAAGDHTITYAGLDGGVGVDKILLLTDMNCVPDGEGNNCLVGAVTTNPDGTTSPNSFNEAMGESGAKSESSSKILFIVFGGLLLVSAAGAAVWLFRPRLWQTLTGPILKLFNHSPQASAFDPYAVVVSNHGPNPSHRHWIIIGTLAFAAIGSALVIYAVASPTSLSFMLANASLTGTAKVVDNEKAIGDKMVEFSTAPGGTASTGSGSPSTGSGSSGGSSGSGGSGGSSGGGSSSSSAQNCPAYPAFPDGNCTGVPSGVVLSAYTGNCTITANNTVIDGKTVNCSLEIQATNVQIKNSRITGTVYTPNGSLAYSFTITDSEVIAPQATGIEQTGIGEANFTALRVEVTGGNRSIYCRKNCTVQDSWVHGQNIAQNPRIHASGIRQSQGATLLHNRIHCSADDTPSGGGCSANLTGYGDFEPVQDNRIEKNLFVATPAGACAYGGSSGDDGSKPYGSQASNIIFKDNIFQRGDGNCGYYFPITDFDDSRPGNEWTNNKWEDGAILPPAN
jgi:uncharacterized membrane protein YgcG